MQHTVWLVVFGVSLLLLCITLLRSRYATRWLAYVGMNIIVAFLLLYGVNAVFGRMSFHLPVNLSTIATVGILGVPGFALLVAVKLTLV